MEIEKPFKCNVCNANFTNEDHLQVHRKKHEMSLSFTKNGVNNGTLESFTDETPTPTRFFRNCEEVGLFQDLQSVNPFDEQFTKAASSASASAADANVPFDFSDAIVSSSTTTTVNNSTITNSRNNSSSNNNNGNSSDIRRRYSDQDTLNTPQVLGYVVNSTSSTTTNTCSMSSVLTPMPSSSNSEQIGAVQTEKEGKLKCVIKIKEAAEEDVIGPTRSASVTEDMRNVTISSPLLPSGALTKNGSSSAIINRTKTKLKLNLSPNVLPMGTVSLSSAENGYEELEGSSSKRTKVQPEKKVELLERNRAAASRSRHRRKQWVSGLEERCQTLESYLAQARAELVKKQAEIQVLQNELVRHANCDVTKATQHDQIHQLLVQSPINHQYQQPNILRAVSTAGSVVAPAVVLSSYPSNGHPSVANSASAQLFAQASKPIPPKPKAKRGRPKKGQERRVDTISIPASTSPGIPLKIQLPVIRCRGDGSGVRIASQRNGS